MVKELTVTLIEGSCLQLMSVKIRLRLLDIKYFIFGQRL